MLVSDPFTFLSNSNPADEEVKQEAAAQEKATDSGMITRSGEEEVKGEEGKCRVL